MKIKRNISVMIIIALLLSFSTNTYACIFHPSSIWVEDIEFDNTYNGFYDYDDVTLLGETWSLNNTNYNPSLWYAESRNYFFQTHWYAGVVYKTDAYCVISPYWYDVDPYSNPYLAPRVYSTTWAGLYDGDLYFQYIE